MWSRIAPGRLAAAREAAEAGDHHWAAELSRHLVRVDADDREARTIKAAALRQIGYTTSNSNWRRNWYLTAAHELDGTIDYSRKLNLAASDQTAAMPAPALLEGLRFRIDPAKAEGVEQSIGVNVADTGDTIGVTIRHGIVETTITIPSDAVLVFTAPKQLLLAVMFRDAPQRPIDAGAQDKLPRGERAEAHSSCRLHRPSVL